MRDENIVEPLVAPEYFVDGFSEHQVADGILTCMAYRLQESPQAGAEPLKVVQFKVVMRVSSALESNERTAQALHAQPQTAVPIAPPSKLLS